MKIRYELCNGAVSIIPLPIQIRELDSGRKRSIIKKATVMLQLSEIVRWSNSSLSLIISAG
jgi:hypothetical protein